MRPQMGTPWIAKIVLVTNTIVLKSKSLKSNVFVSLATSAVCTSDGKPLNHVDLIEAFE
jgi:hypothetical protein